MTTVVNIHRDDCDVYVGRPSLWGNPFRADVDAHRYTVIEQYKDYFLRRVREDDEFRSATKALRGKILGCHCLPKLCHASVIAAYLNGDLD